MNRGDCLYLLDVQQKLKKNRALTELYFSTGELDGQALAAPASIDPEVAISYNPVMDFFEGTGTQYVDERDVDEWSTQ